MEIWQEILEDSQKGAQRLVSEYGRRLYAAAVLLCANDCDAEDLVFRTFEQAVKKIKLFNPEHDIFTWLYSIMINFHRMNLRRRRVRALPMGAAEDLPEKAAGREQPVANANENIIRAVRNLAPQLKEVVVLHYFEDKQVNEIAAILGIPIGTVKSRLHNARERLAGVLSR